MAASTGRSDRRVSRHQPAHCWCGVDRSARSVAWPARACTTGAGAGSVGWCNGRATPPPSPDCFIIQRCAGTDKYGITIVELKGISTSDGFKVENMKAKFETCFQEFMLKDFKNYFNRDFVRIQLYFVSEIEIYRREAGLKMKVLENIRFTFRGQKCSIKPYKPTPAIKPCY